jgi:hypothetical protein
MSSLSLSFIDLNESFPITYSIEFDCSESNLEEVVEKVASFTSKVYATFPALDNKAREQLRKEGVLFGILDGAPSAAECEQFEKTLKNKIITVIHQSKENSSIKLSTIYCPEEILLEVAESVFRDKYHVAYLFPWKTYTEISLKEKGTKLSLKMNFKGP